MNKAFVKEQEEPDDRCPHCESAGTIVLQPTLAAHVPPDALASISEKAFFCPLSSCDVAYFDRFGRMLSTDQLLHPVYPKDPEAPICPCFGLTCDDIDADIAEGGVERVKAHRQQAESDGAQCAVCAADGQSCITAVQRYFMRRRSGGV